MTQVFVDMDMQRQIHTNLVEREVHQHRFRGVSQYHAKRGEFVDWIKIVAEKFRLRETSGASAISYLDRAMDFYEDRIRFFDLQLMAMACLMVGAKMEEQEPDIPVLSSVIKTAGLTCSVAQLSLAELKLLKAWEWNVCVVTPNHFVELYARESALDDMVTGRQQALQHIERITEYAVEGCRLACRDDAMQLFRPSVLATAAVICARTILEAVPHLPPSLMAISGWGYSQSADTSADLGVCCKRLLGLCSNMAALPASSPMAQHAETMEGIQRSLFPDGLGDPIRFPLADLSLDGGSSSKAMVGSSGGGGSAANMSREVGREAAAAKKQQAKAKAKAATAAADGGGVNVAAGATFGPRPNKADGSLVQMFPVMTW